MRSETEQASHGETRPGRIRPVERTGKVIARRAAILAIVLGVAVTPVWIGLLLWFAVEVLIWLLR